MDDKQSQQHVGIICDECKKDNIFGTRYKCMECIDYDLCSDCEKKKLHPEHLMLRLNHLCIDALSEKNCVDICLADSGTTGEFVLTADSSFLIFAFSYSQRCKIFLRWL
jgi:Zinc finger, ZZ type